MGDSILGNDVNLGAGVICANYRLDKAKIPVFINGGKIETGLQKFGSIIGDDSQIGCNAVINPGMLLGKKTLASPVKNIKVNILNCRPLVNQ